MQPVSYLQSDPKWGSIPYTSTGDKTQTIKSSGCGPACAAMIAATYIDPTITPKEACAWSVAKGYRHATQGTLYSFFKAYGKTLGLDWGQLNPSNLRGLSANAAAPYHAKALEAIRAGNLVICCMGPGNWTTGGHYVLWWKEDKGTVYINDPISTKANRVKNTLALLQKEVKYYFVCAVPQEDDMTRDEVKAIVAEVLADMGKLPPSDWAKDELAEAVTRGITDGTRPQGLVTRQEGAIMALRANPGAEA